MKTIINAKKENLSHRAMKLANAMHSRKVFSTFKECLNAAYVMLKNQQVIALADKLLLAYSSYTAALIAAYKCLFIAGAKQTILKGLASAVHCLAKLGHDAESDYCYNAYMVLLLL